MSKSKNVKPTKQTAAEVAAAEVAAAEVAAVSAGGAAGEVAEVASYQVGQPPAAEFAEDEVAVYTKKMATELERITSALLTVKEFETYRTYALRRVIRLCLNPIGQHEKPNDRLKHIREDLTKLVDTIFGE